MGEGRKSSRFTRRSRNLPLRKFIVVACEGARTERQYIEAIRSCFQRESQRRTGKRIVVNITTTKASDQSAPENRLRDLKKTIDVGALDDNYSAWLICDRDEWTSEQFERVELWVKQDPDKNHWILSAPNFEYWLSLHFESKEERANFFRRYDKKIKTSDFSYEQVVAATRKARKAYANNDDLLVGDGSQMFLFVEFLAKEFGLDDDFRR